MGNKRGADVLIRPETPADPAAISALTTAAFAGAEHSSGTEAAIVDALRAAGALSLSLVAEDEEGRIIGHAAFCPITIDGAELTDGRRWFGLGPVSVAPDAQGQGVGAKLIRDGLALLQATDAGGCVVLGDPAYYGRFGFEADLALLYPGVPPEYFQRLVFADDVACGPTPAGMVAYHPAFTVG